MSVALAEAGCNHVYGLDLPAKPSSDVEASQAYVTRFGSKLHYLSADVTDKSGITETIVGIAKKHGRLDVSVAAAGVLGVASGQHCTQYSESEWRKVIDINLSGVFFTSAAAAQGMLETKTPAGSIIMIASMSGSITNRVSRGVRLSRCVKTSTYPTPHRAMHGSLTTAVNPGSFNSLARWPVSWGKTTSVSIRSPRATSIPRYVIYTWENSETHLSPWTTPR
jgi:NAD(P)-dependent dehydrogenase (short-subunit alcohol dehydrogenase family)